MLDAGADTPPISLLALDLDGTLLDSRGHVSPRNRQALVLARERGVAIALVTGRRFRDARPLALELGLDVPVISHNGALTKHARTLETVAVRLLPAEVARTLVEIGLRCGVDPMVSEDHEGLGRLVYDRVSENNQALQSYITWSRRTIGVQADDESAIRCVASLAEYMDHPPVHISFSGSCRAMAEFGAVLKDELGDRIQVMNTIYPQQDFTLLDVIHPYASKGAGLAAVAHERDVGRAAVMAIGDNFNDLEMLRYAGTGVLMGNAAQSLREDNKRFYVTSTNDEAGVALAIERFILARP